MLVPPTFFSARFAGAALLGSLICSGGDGGNNPQWPMGSTAGLLELVQTTPNAAQVEPRRPGLSASAEQARSKALEKALRHLAESQRGDGGWDLSDARERAPIAVTALGSLALMSSGSPRTWALRSGRWALDRLLAQPRRLDAQFGDPRLYRSQRRSPVAHAWPWLRHARLGRGL